MNLPSTGFDSMHIRRGDFQYSEGDVPAEDLVQQCAGDIHQNALVYVASDEHDKEFFDPLSENYSLLFLDDFSLELEGVDRSYYGMIDQLVAARGETFFGTFPSTFTGYINRLRGYYSTKEGLEGSADGIIKSFYFSPEDRKLDMQKYVPVQVPESWLREYPVAWMNIDLIDPTDPAEKKE